MKTKYSYSNPLTVVQEERQAFDAALRADVLSECSNRLNYIERFNYLGAERGQYFFQHVNFQFVILNCAI